MDLPKIVQVGGDAVEVTWPRIYRCPLCRRTIKTMDPRRLAGKGSLTSWHYQDREVFHICGRNGKPWIPATREG